ncbi:hypothetical protein Ahy_B01g052070 isoform A [Arachis hypogaea]|uniref:CCHC-type domain-containing protein n=1 Tax=Arachis hypogaea TaxID=3818 RepID=A0A445ANG6_ARAHY|nr:hypothetical protein Ahy_B01g052070 isoform A [Arachis hypogaea]
MEAQEKKNKAFDPCPTIPVSKDEFDEWCKPWHAALVVKFLGKKVGLGFMEQRLTRDWVKKGKINVIDMDRDYFLVHFSDEEDYSHALLDGLWMIAVHYLIVQRWRPFFLTSESTVKKIAAWFRIPNLPIKLYNHRFLWQVGSAIGTMLKIDRATSIHSRGRFARIYVEIDLTKKLVPRISVLGSTLNIEYEGLHLICFQCGKYGHRSDQCSEVAVRVEGSPKDGNVETPVEEKEGQPEGSITGDLAIQSKCANQGVNCVDQAPADFGPWMMGDMNQGSEDGSRFNILIDGGAPSTSKDPYKEDMEQAIMENMRGMVKQQWEDFNATRNKNTSHGSNEDTSSSGIHRCAHHSDPENRRKSVIVGSAPEKPPDATPSCVTGTTGTQKNSVNRGRTVRNRIEFDGMFVEDARGQSGEILRHNFQFVHMRIHGKNSSP